MPIKAPWGAVGKYDTDSNKYGLIMSSRNAWPKNTVCWMGWIPIIAQYFFFHLRSYCNFFLHVFGEKLEMLKLQKVYVGFYCINEGMYVLSAALTHWKIVVLDENHIRFQTSKYFLCGLNIKPAHRFSFPYWHWHQRDEKKRTFRSERIRSSHRHT